MLGTKLKHVVFAFIPTVLLLLTAEVLARVELRLRHGYGYAEALAYLPDPALVYRNNPRHHLWKDRPDARFQLFFIPPPLEHGPHPRVLVLGGSTSEVRHDGSDWPNVLQLLSGSTVINFGYSGYGTGQLQILYDRYGDTVRPDLVILFSGWNLRGSVTSPLGWRPANTSLPTDGVLQRVSAGLMNYSALYGRLWHFLDSRTRPPTCRTLVLPTREWEAWKQEYRALAQGIVRGHPLYVVVPPSLTMREDAKDALPSSFRCIAEDFEASHARSGQISESIAQIGREVGATLLDVRPAYLELPVDVHVSFFTDRIHQTAEGNRYLGEAIYNALNDAAPGWTGKQRRSY